MEEALIIHILLIMAMAIVGAAVVVPADTAMEALKQEEQALLDKDMTEAKVEELIIPVVEVAQEELAQTLLANRMVDPEY